MSPEVLIYLQTVKNYLTTNDDARIYFIGSTDEELFYEHLAQISQKNYEKDGEVMLSKEQFELLRKTMKVVSIAKGNESLESNPLFFHVPNYGYFSLN